MKEVKLGYRASMPVSTSVLFASVSDCRRMDGMDGMSRCGFRVCQYG